jgi:hypothetical protein
MAWRIPETGPVGGKEARRPRLRWLEDAENDLRELKMKMWRRKTYNTNECACVVKEAKVLREPQRQPVNK